MIQYSISQDTAAASVNTDKLRIEIALASCTSGVVNVMVQGDILSLSCDVITNQEALDAVVHAHVAVSLDDVKNTKRTAIDTKTNAIISTGFAFDGHTFSLSAEAQRNWLGVYALRDVLTFPLNTTCQPFGIYSLTTENLTGFITAAFSKVAYAITTGQVLKAQTAAAATQEELDAVVDTR